MSTIGSSTSTTTTSSLTAKTGMGGLVSGMDIDALVESLSAASRNKIIKQKQSIQLFEWKQTAYRSASTVLKEFQAKYLDVLSKTNMRSEAFFKTTSSTSASDAVTVSASSSAFTGKITVNSISQLATNQTVKTNGDVSKALSGKMTSAVAGTMTETDIESLLTGLSGKSILMNLDGQSKTITFDSTFIDSVTASKTTATLQSSMQDLVDKAFGVTDPLKRVATLDIQNDQLSFSAIGSKLTLSSVGTDTATLGLLGFESGQSNKIALTNSLEDASFKTTPTEGVEDFKFSINAINFSFSKGTSVSSVISEINSSNAGVTLSYSSITDQFVMTAKQTGAGDNIVISETSGNLMAAFGLSSDPVISENTAGLNAILSVNGQSITRSTNTIDIDGVNVTLVKETATAFDITSTSDASSLVEPIKTFVADYNTLIESFNKSLKETINRDYPPLTDVQREEMSETQIKAWEEKAKSGLLRGDSILRGISSKLQSAMAGISIDGTSLYSLGITSAGYTENGKLQIDETRLKSALASNPDGVRDLFTSAGGLGETLNTIINNAIKTTGPKGTRGSLTEAAGVAATTSDTQNYLTEQIGKSNKNIITLTLRLEAEETRLWRSFSAMESALSSLNNQSSYLSQFSAG